MSTFALLAILASFTVARFSWALISTRKGVSSEGAPHRNAALFTASFDVLVLASIVLGIWLLTLSQ